MKVVPWRLERMTVERALRVVTRAGQRAVTALHGDSAGFEDRAFVLADEVNCQVLARGVHLEANILERIGLALGVKKGSSDRRVDRDRLDLVPPVQAAVRGDRVLE
jgi:hypothetical protein